MGRKQSTQSRGRLADLSLLALRAGAGGIMAGHGAQKLFGSFGGHGLDGTAGWLGSLGLTPPKAWATLAAVSEFGGGALTALGLGGPVGPLAMQGAMISAARRAHWKLPLFVTSGGAEVPILYSLIGLSLATGGAGRYSLDSMFDVQVSKKLVALTIAGVAAGVYIEEKQIAEAKRNPPPPPPTLDESEIDPEAATA